MDIDNDFAKSLDVLVGALAALGWSVEDICARVKKTYELMEGVLDEWK